MDIVISFKERIKMLGWDLIIEYEINKEDKNKEDKEYKNEYILYL